MGYYSNLSMEILGDRTQVAILRFLYKNLPNCFSQKQIGSSIGINPASISRTCNSLEQLNLLDRFNAGKTILYKLDEDSYIVRKILIPLFKNEKDFFGDLTKDILRSLDQNLKSLIKEIFLFGSILKGKDMPSSDIDLAIVLRGVNGNGLRRSSSENNKIEKIREHFLNEAVKFKLNLDLHVFIEDGIGKEKGLSLNDVYKEGELIWENNNEKLSKK